MLSHVILGCRLPGDQKRIKLDEIDIKNTTIPQLREQITQTLNVRDDDYDVIYAGRMLKDGSLESYGIRNGVTLHVIKRQVPHTADAAESFDKSTLPTLLTSLQAALLNPAHQHLVTKILTSRDNLENLIAATPGLEYDLKAQALLQTPELLINLANPDDAEEILKDHPCLAHAAMMLAAAINEEASRTGMNKTQSVGSYSLDQMSDDEDIDEPRPAITTSQLASALANAGHSSGQSGPRTITNDFFQQAMAQAMGNIGQSSSERSQGAAELGPQVMETQLQQLREMGITDDAAARQALQAAGGNVQMALSILFGDVHEMI